MDPLVDTIVARSQLQRTGYIVIGASAGAVEVLGQLLPGLGASTRVSVLIVVHIPQDRNSLLTSVFQPKCALEVIEPHDKQYIEPAQVVFAPPGYHMLVEHQKLLSLSTDPPVHYSRPSIDVLFESAADALGSQVLGIILTGANSDGAAGLRAICDQGGIAVVQAPGDAEASTMPQSALELCPEAYVLSVSQLAELFKRL